MPKRIYLVVLGGLVAAALVAGVAYSPFTQKFDRFTLPLLSLIIALPWLLHPSKVAWRIGRFLCSALVFSTILYFIRTSGGQHLTDFRVSFVAALVSHFLILRMLVTERSIRSAFLAQHLTVGFVSLMDIYLRVQGIQPLLQPPSQYVATARFLFLAPLASMILWAQGEMEAWQNWTKVLLVCSVFQVGIGMFDVFAHWNIRSALYGACVFWFGALGIAVHWIKRLESAGRKRA
jgi:hypothetical protein